MDLQGEAANESSVKNLLSVALASNYVLPLPSIDSVDHGPHRLRLRTKPSYHMAACDIPRNQ